MKEDKDAILEAQSAHTRPVRCCAALLCAFLFVIGIALSACNTVDSTDGTVAQVTTTTQHISEPSPKPTPTATRTPVSAGPVLLGGNEQAFINEYGAPDSRSNVPFGDLRFISPGNSSPDGLQVQLDIADGSPYNQRAELITNQPPNANSGGTWESSVAHSMCGRFIPADATKKTTLTLYDGEGKANGVDELYFSSWLAQQFPASSFEDGKQNPVQPGLFDITYYYQINVETGNYDSNQITYCELAIGTTGDAFAR